jgi:hypothetical protein
MDAATTAALREIDRIVAEGDAQESYADWMVRLRRAANLDPVVVDGSRERGYALGYFMTELTDGSKGYFQRDGLDCLRMAIASCAQIPPYLVPDLKLPERIAAGQDRGEIEREAHQKMMQWEKVNGVDLRVHVSPPRSARRWIGVEGGSDGDTDHCYLMSGSHCLFDPGEILPGEMDQSRVNIDYGVTFD